MPVDQRALFIDKILGKLVDHAYWKGNTLVLVFTNSEGEEPIIAEFSLESPPPTKRGPVS